MSSKCTQNDIGFGGIFTLLIAFPPFDRGGRLLLGLMETFASDPDYHKHPSVSDEYFL